MNTDKPKAKGDLHCPLQHKPMKMVCHKCAFWTHIAGRNPNTGEMFDNWDCAIAIMPILSIENAMLQRQTGAALESFRNEMVKTEQAKLAMAAPVLVEAQRRLNDAKGHNQ